MPYVTGLTPRQRGALLVGSGAYALIFFDQTATTAALSDIERDLGASVSQLQWVIGAYLLALAAITPVAGKLGDSVGRRRMFVAGMALFGAASLACALAPSIDALIGLRIAQGVGGAFARPLARANVTVVVPAERRGWAIGIMATGGSIFLSLGPLIGGALIDLGGWRWVFAVAVPIVVLALAGTLRWIPETRETDPPPLDVIGLGLLVVGLAALVVGLLQTSAWGAAPVAATLAVAVVLLGAFAVVEHRVAHPLVHLRLLRVPAVDGYLIALLAGQFAVTALTVELMLFLQRTLGYQALAAGLLFLPAVAATPLLSPWTGRLSDRGRGRLIVSGGLLIAGLALVWLAVAAGRESAWILLPGLALFGLARPFIFTPASTGPMGVLPADERGLAAGLVTEAYQLGAVLGVAVSGVIVASADETGDFTGGVQLAIAVCAAVCLAGALAARALLPPRAAQEMARPTVETIEAPTNTAISTPMTQRMTRSPGDP
jgi:EmrB/QacA subfamily drug resistance transporter